MLKLTSVALSLLALVSIVPSAQAGLIFNGDNHNSQPQIKVIINPQTKTQDRYDSKYDDKYDNYKSYQERKAALRRREWEARREAYRRYQRSQYYSNSRYNRDSYDRYDDDKSYYNYRDRH
jgi:hypothetical protein